MTDEERKHAIQQMRNCDTLAKLRQVWLGLGFGCHMDPEVKRSRDEFKAKLTDGRAGA